MRSVTLVGFKTFLLLITSIFSIAQENKGWKPLTERYPRQQIAEILQSPENSQLYPPATDRTAWEKIPGLMKERWIKRGEQALEYEWQVLPATLFLDYARTGNRRPYSPQLYERRIKLRQLVLAECIEYKGRFMDQIINGVWLICEESFWGIPAHIGMQKAGMGLPDVSEPIVDLFAAETAEMLAWSVYLLREKLDEVSPLVYERVKLETQRRVLEPVLQRNDFWWMGFKGKVGNWNPWICSNWMAAALLLVDDEQERSSHVFKILKVLDAYISKNPEDGVSDEGPHYWGHAAGSLFDALELLYSVTNGKFDIYNDPLITRMGQYLNRMHINEQYYFNYADAVPYIRNNAFLVYHYGERINDPSLMDLGAYLVRFGDYEKRAGVHDAMGRVLRELFLIDEMQTRTEDHLFLRDVWMPVSQLMTAREKEGSTEGFFLGAKAGHNAEGQGHNHNDVGNFIVYYGGDPVLIDVGMATYNSRTFGPDRYKIWNNQSAYHNLPTVNGVMQQEGVAFRADNVVYKSGSKQATLSMDIAGAYPQKAGLGSWVRTVRLDRQKGIYVTEDFRMEKASDSIWLSLMTICKVNVTEPGTIEFNLASEKDKRLWLSYPSEKLEVELERLPLNTPDDPRIKENWGDHLIRILFKTKSKLKEDRLVFHIKDR